jgi:hypothetical protein
MGDCRSWRRSSLTARPLHLVGIRHNMIQASVNEVIIERLGDHIVLMIGQGLF